LPPLVEFGAYRVFFFFFLKGEASVQRRHFQLDLPAPCSPRQVPMFEALPLLGLSEKESSKSFSDDPVRQYYISIAGPQRAAELPTADCVFVFWSS